jgi:hypothetical protein
MKPLTEYSLLFSVNKVRDLQKIMFIFGKLHKNVTSFAHFYINTIDITSFRFPKLTSFHITIGFDHTILKSLTLENVLTVYEVTYNKHKLTSIQSKTAFRIEHYLPYNLKYVLKFYLPVQPLPYRQHGSHYWWRSTCNGSILRARNERSEWLNCFEISILACIASELHGVTIGRSQ